MLNYAKVEELGEGVSTEEKPAEEHSAATNHCRAQTKRKTQNHLTQNNFIVAVASDTKRNSTKSHLSLQDKGAQVSVSMLPRNIQQEMSIQKTPHQRGMKETLSFFI